MGELHALWHALGAAGEEHDGGGVVVGELRARLTKQAGERGEFRNGADARAHVLEVDQLEPGGGERLELELRLLDEGAGGDDLLQPGELRAGEHDRGAGRVVEERGCLAERPEREQGDGCGVDVGQQHADAFGVRREQRAPLAGEEGGADEEAAVGERAVDVAQDRLVAGKAGGLAEGRGDGARAEGVLHGEALLAHALQGPVAEAVAGVGGVHVADGGRREHFAEVHGHAWEPAFAVRVARPGQAMGAAQVGGDDPGVGAVEEEAGAVEELHQRAGEGDAALGEEHETAAGLEVFRHVLGGVGRERIHREGAAALHDPAMDEGRLCGGRGGDEAPVALEADAEEEPVEPRHMVGQEQDRAGGAQHRGVVRAEAETEAEEEAEKGEHLGGEMAEPEEEDLELSVGACRGTILRESNTAERSLRRLTTDHTDWHGWSLDDPCSFVKSVVSGSCCLRENQGTDG